MAIDQSPYGTYHDTAFEIGYTEEMTSSYVQQWIDTYVQAWRSPGTAQLAEIFASDISYRVSPWKEPIRGLKELGPFWEGARDSSEEVFTIQNEIVVLHDNIAVVRIFVEYAHDAPRKWRDLWIITFNDEGLCSAFEEWPFAEAQYDGQK